MCGLLGEKIGVEKEEERLCWNIARAINKGVLLNEHIGNMRVCTRRSFEYCSNCCAHAP